MNLEALINAVKNGEQQDKQSLESFVAKVADGSVSTEDATRWLKAVHQHGCTVDDTVVLTNAMIESGARLKWQEGAPVVDKHSTGGVGDKMSLMLAPALAAAGCRVPMLAGRGIRGSSFLYRHVWHPRDTCRCRQGPQKGTAWFRPGPCKARIHGGGCY